MAGWLLLDKPLGISSAKALNQVKRLMSVRRAGHTGTLDPQASGLLALGLGAATRWCAHLLEAPKAYQFTLCLGVETDSQDSEGQVVREQSVPEISLDEIEVWLSRFRGPIRQIPPMHSALKHQGRRLYELAREGQTVARAAREVTIESLQLRAQRGSEWDLEMHCSKGTYVRTLAHDLGQAIGCGAHVTALRRTALGRFEISQAITLEQLDALSPEQRAGRLLPVDAPLPDWPAHRCTTEETQALCRGQRIAAPDLHGWVRLYDQQAGFFGVAEVVASGELQPRRLMPT